MSQTIQTPLTKLLRMQNPVMLAGMGQVAGTDLVAAVSNAGGLGVMGGVNYKPHQMKQLIEEIKSKLTDKNLPFGVDLLLPQIGGNARKTNKDYTGGQLEELIDVICEGKVSLFVSAVGVPPKWAVDKLHAAGIPVMNMIGSPKHVPKALEVGVDIICAQGGEGGGHTGEVATSILVPACVDLCKKATSPLFNCPVPVVAAGGISDGRGLAMALSLGAQAVWVGTRFVASEEANASSAHKRNVVKIGHHDTIRTIIYSGRPMRVIKNSYILDCEENRQAEIKELAAKGELLIMKDVQKMQEDGKMDWVKLRPFLSGVVAGNVNKVESAKDIIKNMVQGCIDALKNNYTLITEKDVQESMQPRL